jgi:2-haloacid dehalogenase
VRFDDFTHLSFDCYGTLIDWETGILTVLRAVLERHDRTAQDEALLRLYAGKEAEQEAGDYRPYRDVLRNVMVGVAETLVFEPTETDLDALPDSVGRWPPFADTVAALKRLKTRFKLVILSNIDDAMFAETNRLLEVEFDDVVTAGQVGSYKPSHANFEHMLDRLRVPRQRVLHVAQSIFHDHAPAKALGFTTVRVNRESRCPGTGVAPPAHAEPDLEVPDLLSLVNAAGL